LSALYDKKMLRKIKAVALDLDGTTLNNHHEVSERTSNILKILADKGILIRFEDE
jgi:hydroxymethylpyrimidine pyrophosphatase-like HAD family hydrolase